MFEPSRRRGALSWRVASRAVRPADFVSARYAPSLATNLELLSALQTPDGDGLAADEAWP